MALSAEQLAIRKSRLSATDIGAIVGVNPFKSPADVVAEKLFDLEPLAETDAMLIGNLWEEPIVRHAAKILGVGLSYPLPTVIHPTHPVLCCTPDAGVAGVDGEREGIEAKTAGIVRGFVEAREWGPPGSDQVPDRYKCQALTQMAVMGWEVVYLAAVLAGRGFAIYEIPRRQPDIDGIVEIAGHWWARHIVERKPIEVDGQIQYPSLATLKRVRRVPNSPREVPGLIVGEYLAAAARAKEAGQMADAAKAALLASIGDGDAAAVDGVTVATYYRQKRRGYAVAASEYPVLRLQPAADGFALPEPEPRLCVPAAKLRRLPEPAGLAVLPATTPGTRPRIVKPKAKRKAKPGGRSCAKS